MRNRNIAIVDLETTGLDEERHEIIEVGMVVVDQGTLEIIDTLDMKVKPTHPETASPRAIEVNGYNKTEWVDAESLKTAMIALTTKAKGAIFCSQNVTFDWKFVNAGFNKTGVVDLMDYHRIDLFTMSWMKLRNTTLGYFNLEAVTKFLGLDPEPIPHCGINGAMNGYEVFKQLINWNDVVIPNFGLSKRE
jgi:DNA polymerase III alpha subunit (gram-positive type)